MEFLQWAWDILINVLGYYCLFAIVIGVSWKLYMDRKRKQILVQHPEFLQKEFDWDD